MPKNFNLIQAEEDSFFEESNSNRLRAMHEALEDKMGEVYRRIKQSQNLEIEKEFEVIRKKILSSNTNYETEGLRSQELQGDISHFYRIPKKEESHGYKNLDYEGTSSMKRTNNLLKPVTQQRMDLDRGLASR